MSGKSSPRDWLEWHRGYADPHSSLSRRLAIVQAQVARALDERADASIRVLSMCSGEGRDLIEPAVRLGAGPRLRGRLVELNPTLAGRSRDAIAAAGLDGLEVREADAGLTSAYEGATPADLVLVCGVFGNISDDDIQRTVRALPAMCAPGAMVIWTRHRNPPDLTPSIRRRFVDSGFRHEAFVRVPGLRGVGVERYVGPPMPFQSDVRLFDFQDE